jgi:hypothetical protein
LGTLAYDGSMAAEFDDRLLTHLQIVISQKLRRGEPFIFSWRDVSAIGGGRTALWLHPAIPLTYKYFGGKMPIINRNWIDVLAESANSASGLQVIREPQSLVRADD